MKITKLNNKKSYLNKEKLALILFIFTLTFSFCKSDLPVHCLRHQVCLTFINSK